MTISRWARPSDQMPAIFGKETEELLVKNCEAAGVPLSLLGSLIGHDSPRTPPVFPIESDRQRDLKADNTWTQRGGTYSRRTLERLVTRAST